MRFTQDFYIVQGEIENETDNDYYRIYNFIL